MDEVGLSNEYSKDSIDMFCHSPESHIHLSEIKCKHGTHGMAYLTGLPAKLQLSGKLGLC